MNGNRTLPYRVTLRISTSTTEDDGTIRDGSRHVVRRVRAQSIDEAIETAKRNARDEEGFVAVVAVLNVERMGG